MPKVTYKGQTFVLRWKPEHDLQLLVVAILFKEGCKKCTKMPFINWKKAEAQNFLKGLPNLSRKRLSKRVTYLLGVRFNPAGYEKARAYLKIHPPISFNNTHKKKAKIFRDDVDRELQVAHGYKPKKLWSEKQEKILLHLVGKYRKGAMSADWKALMKDKLVQFLPHGYTLKRLRSYYGTRICGNKNPQRIEQRRKAALEYKRKNYKKYVKSLRRNVVIVKNTVNDFLQAKIEVR